MVALLRYQATIPANQDAPEEPLEEPSKECGTCPR